jgi:hypothetical protein
MRLTPGLLPLQIVLLELPLALRHLVARKPLSSTGLIESSCNFRPHWRLRDFSARRDETGVLHPEAGLHPEPGTIRMLGRKKLYSLTVIDPLEGNGQSSRGT